MLKRFITPVLALLLTLALGSTIVAQDEPIEIFMRLSVPEVGPPDQDTWYWTQQISEDLGIDVEVTFVASDEELLPTINTRAAANDLPDLFFSRDRTILTEFADQGLLADWSPYVDLMPTFMAERATEAVAPFGMFDDTRFGLAVQNAGPFERPTLAIREDWLNTVGLEVPTDLEEMFTVMEAFTYDDPDGDGEDNTWGARPTFRESEIANPVQDLFFVYAAFGALGEWRFAEDGSVEFTPATTDRRDAVEYISRLQAAGVLHPDWLGGGAAIGEAWKIGQVGVHNSDFCATFCPQGFGEFASANPDGILTPIDAPVGPEGEAGTGRFAVSATNYMMSANAEAEGKGEAIAAFLEWLATDGYLLTAYGIEGENWTRDDSGRIIANEDVVPAPFTLPDYQAIFQVRNIAYKGGDEEMRVRYENIITHPNGQTVNPFEVLADNRGRPVDLTAFSLMPSAAEVGVESVDLFTYITTGELDFILGNRSFDEWDDYVAGMEQFGLSDWVAAANDRAAELGIMGDM